MFLSSSRTRWIDALTRATLAGLFCWLAVLFPSLADAAPRAFSNQTRVTYTVLDGNVQVQGSVESNLILVQLPARANTLAFYTDNTFTRTAGAGSLNQRLFVQAESETCDRTDGIDQVTIRLYSETLKTGVDVTAYETDVHSGLFRTNADLMALAGVVTTTDDRLWATLEGCGDTATSAIEVEPSGVVFDSQSGLPLAGARVTLIDITGSSNGGQAGSAAHVLAADGVTEAPNSVTTGPDGRYRFGFIQPGTYRLAVQLNDSWAYPSTAAAAQLQANHSINATSSYGQAFTVTALAGSDLPDLPLDPLSRILRVQLTASRSTVEIAESVIYTVTVRNAGQAVLDSIVLAGQLPTGFAFVPGSARQDGKNIGDPALASGAVGAGSGKGPAMRLAIGRLDPGATTTITYRALVHAGATQGDGTHRVQARADLPVATPSNTASVRVEVQPGVFSDKAMVLGTVFADCNNNGVQDAGEPGAPGVRLVLQDGSYAITDSLGHYSFYGLRPRTHVLKIDALSLPAGATPVAISQRHAGDGYSRFVDPRKGQLARADFALAGCSPELRDALHTRAARMRGDRELEQSTRTQMTPDGSARAIGDRRALQASGQIGVNGVNGVNGVAAPAAAASASAAAAAAVASSAPASASTAAVATAKADEAAADESLEDLAGKLDSKLEFLDITDGQTLAGRLLLVRTKGRANAGMTLEVNGEAVSEQRIGQRAVNATSQTELREYIGVQLRAGKNTLTLTERDGFGNVRGERSVTVLAPGELAQIRITTPRTPGAADSQTVTQVQVELLDRDGLRIAGRSAVTLDGAIGGKPLDWDLRDLDALAPGVQTFVENGVGSFGLRAPNAAGDAEIKASAGGVAAAAHYRYAPALRPMIAVGLVEGVLNLRKLRPNQILAAGPDDGFDAELRQNTITDAAKANGEKTGARASLYLKGKVSGETLLTLGYESDKDRRERLFRDIQPDAFYPVYGDDSIKGFDAQSTSRLYVRLEQGASALLYGDFTTQSANPARQLGAYQRSLTGARATHNGERFTGSAFASRDTSRQLIVEQRGNGTSGPYDLGNSDVLVNSEKVELLVRDRNQPSVVLRSTLQQRFADYDFEPLTGRLLMRAPVPSTDADLNPVSIRVTAETDQGGDKFWVAGADGQYKLTDSLEVGGAVVRDWNPLAPLQLYSANTSIKLAERTTLIAEAAHTRRPDDLPALATTTPTPGTPALGTTGNGDAQRIELQHDGAALKGRIYASRADANFSNPSSTLTAGRTEAGAKGEYRLDTRTRLLGEALHSEDLGNNRRRDGVLLGVERSFEGGVKAEVGVRHVAGTADAATLTSNPTTTSTDTSVRDSSTALRAKLSTVIPQLPSATAFIEGEQDTQSSDKHMAAVGGDWQLPGNTGRVYARHEFISSLTGPYSLDATQRRNTTLLGIDSAAPFDGRGFGEYRLRDGISGREAEAAMGLRNQWSLAQGLRLNTSFERVQSLQGVAGNQSAAATAAIEYTADPRFKSSARLEVRHASTGDSVLASLATAYKMNDDWTLLGRGVEQLNKGVNGQPDREQQRVQLGVAYRDSTSNKINGLARYELKRETGLGAVAAASTDIAAADGSRIAHVVSTHADYQVSRSLVLSGQVAAKLVTETIDGQRLTSNARLISGRVTKDLGDRWDVGVAASMMAGAGARNTAIGGEAGYRVQDNMWVSLGYNFRGFKDRELSADNHTERGVFLRLRFKFDERSFGARGN